MLHVIAHGQVGTDGQPEIVLEDGYGGGLPMPTADLAVLLAGTDVRCAVFMACHTAAGSAQDGRDGSIGSSLLRGGVGAVVTMRQELPDRAAQEFSDAFYRALTTGEPSAPRSNSARRAMRVSAGAEQGDWAVPVLHTRDPNARLLLPLAEQHGDDRRAAAFLASAQARVAALPRDVVPEPTPLPGGSRLPLAPNPLFVGRDPELRALAGALAGDGQVTGPACDAAVSGLGGLGKTQLGVEFAHRYGSYFLGGVFWLSFADPEAVAAEVAACGGGGGMALQTATFSELKLDEQVQLVRAAWQQPLPRLLVFDNCEDEALLARWRPTSGGARVLVTSRRAEWDAALGVRTLSLGILERAASVALLRAHRPDLPADDPALEAIAAELGDLPLALHLAGSFLGRYRRVLAPAAYLEHLRSPGLLQHQSLSGAGISPTGHEQHVARTFGLSYQRLDPASRPTPWRDHCWPARRTSRLGRADPSQSAARRASAPTPRIWTRRYGPRMRCCAWRSSGSRTPTARRCVCTA